MDCHYYYTNGNFANYFRLAASRYKIVQICQTIQAWFKVANYCRYTILSTAGSSLLRGHNSCYKWAIWRINKYYCMMISAACVNN